MSSSRKTVLGILSFIPLIFSGIWLYIFVRWVIDFLPKASAYEGSPELMLQNMGGLFGSAFALMLPAGMLTIGLIVYYIIQVVNNKAMPEGERIVWIIVLILFSSIAFPVYWIMRVRPLPPKGTGPLQPADLPNGPTYS